MPSARERLLALIRERAYIEGEVTLASGQKSDFYIDGKMIQLMPEGAHLLGEALFAAISDLKIDAVGGIAVGAVPLVTALVVSCHHHGRGEIEGFFVRDTAKSHGTQKVIEGKLAPKSRVVIVEDVVTSGKSAMKAVDAVRAIGCEIVSLVAVVDRESGGAAFFKEQGLPFRSIFTRTDVLGKRPV